MFAGIFSRFRSAVLKFGLLCIVSMLAEKHARISRLNILALCVVSESSLRTTAASQFKTHIPRGLFKYRGFFYRLTRMYLMNRARGRWPNRTGGDKDLVFIAPFGRPSGTAYALTPTRGDGVDSCVPRPRT